MNKSLPYLFIAIITGSVSSWFAKAYYQPFPVSYWQQVYDHSQYCVPRCEFQGNIDDPELYTLAGFRYAEGVSPDEINYELQPLTKYLFGISTHLVGNPLIVQIIFAIIMCVLTYHLARRLLTPTLSIIPPLLLIFDPLIIVQLTRPFLDLSVAVWTLIFILFLTRNKWGIDWWWGGVTLGALALSKSFSLAAVVSLMGLIIMRKQIKLYLKVVGIAVCTYLLGYSVYFMRGHTLYDFAVLHLDILRLYRSYVPEYPKGEIFRIIFTGQWRTWYGDKGLIPVTEWSIVWPLAMVGAVFAAIRTRYTEQRQLLPHLIWIALCLIFISLRLVFPRYLVPLLPSLYIAGLWGLSKIKIAA